MTVCSIASVELHFGFVENVKLFLRGPLAVQSDIYRCGRMSYRAYGDSVDAAVGNCRDVA